MVISNGHGLNAYRINSYTSINAISERSGIDPVYFGIMFIINCSISLITPPVGNVLNVVCGVAKLKFDDAVKALRLTSWFLFMLLALFIFIPELITAPLKWMS